MTLRRANIARIDGGLFDVLVVGGGINGAVSAASLAGRGASVALIDRGDFGSFTSQESSNLVWGGFKYLENYELPARVQAVPLAQPADEGLPRQHQGDRLPRHARPQRRRTSRGSRRSAPPRYWVIGLFGTQPPARARRRADRARGAGRSTRRTARGGIEYHDAFLIDNDARFVFSFVRSAIEAGAAAANYVELVSAERVGDRWVARLRDVDSGEEFTTIGSRRSSTRPARSSTSSTRSGACTTEHRIVYSKGIHLVVPRLTTTRHDRVLAFFDDTQRLFYVIPMGRRSVIGTTDTRVDTPFTRRHRRRPRVPARADQRPARPARAAHRRRHHRRALRRAPARRRRRAAATTRTPTGPR